MCFKNNIDFSCETLIIEISLTYDGSSIESVSKHCFDREESPNALFIGIFSIDSKQSRLTAALDPVKGIWRDSATETILLSLLRSDTRNNVDSTWIYAEFFSVIQRYVSKDRRADAEHRQKR